VKKEIQKVLNLWCWATFTDGRFVITRFCGDEVLAEVSADKFYRDSFEQYQASDVFEGLEYLVTAGRYTIPGERDKRTAQYHADPEGRPRGYLRFVEWGVIALAMRVNRKGHEAIKERRASGRR
jgi:hypothetical protein